MEKSKKPIVCLPGQRLCVSDKINIPGPGTYEQQGYIYSKHAGVVNLIQEDNTRTIAVRSVTDESIVPAPGDIVTAMIAVVKQRFCKCSIKCVGDNVLTRPYRGVLRKQDVRSVDRDSVQMYKSFRPGDIILARVLPMTEPYTYQLSTAENELGVIIALSEQGVPMIPINWTQMQCPKTLRKEYRKVAKVVPEHVVTEQIANEQIKNKADTII